MGALKDPSDTPTLYVVTAYQFNHVEQAGAD